MLKYLGPLPKTCLCRDKHSPSTGLADNQVFTVHLSSAMGENAGAELCPQDQLLLVNGTDLLPQVWTSDVSPVQRPYERQTHPRGLRSMCCGKTDTSQGNCCVSTLPHPFSIQSYRREQTANRTDRHGRRGQSTAHMLISGATSPLSLRCVLRARRLSFPVPFPQALVERKMPGLNKAVPANEEASGSTAEGGQEADGKEEHASTGLTFNPFNQSSDVSICTALFDSQSGQVHRWNAC